MLYISKHLIIINKIYYKSDESSTSSAKKFDLSKSCFWQRFQEDPSASGVHHSSPGCESEIIRRSSDDHGEIRAAEICGYDTGSRKIKAEKSGLSSAIWHFDVLALPDHHRGDGVGTIHLSPAHFASFESLRELVLRELIQSGGARNSSIFHSSFTQPPQMEVMNSLRHEDYLNDSI